MPSVLDVLERRGIDVRELAEAQRDPRSELDAGWDHGGVTDRELWSVLLRCGKRGLPAEVVMSLPASVRGQGLRAFQHLFRRVLLVSDESLGAHVFREVTARKISRHGPRNKKARTIDFY